MAREMTYKLTDNNQKQIVKCFRDNGFSVVSLAAMGKGVPDLIVGKGNVNYLVEVKNGPKAKLTPDQIKFHAEWQGQKCVVSSLDDLRGYFFIEVKE